MITYLFSKVLFLTVTGTAAFLFIWIIQHIFARKMSRRWSYYIWLIPIMVFLLPFSAHMIEPAKRETVPAVSVSAPVVQTQPIQSNNPIQKARDVLQEKGLPSAEEESNTVLLGNAEQIKKNKGQAIPFAEILPLVWLTVAAGILFFRLIMKVHFNRKLNIIGEAPEQDIIRIFYMIKEEMGIKKSISLKLIRAHISPFLTGLRKPVIVLPESVSMEELPLVLRHELTHFKRNDLFYRTFVHIVIAIHWFNPFVYWMDWEMTRQMELSCDEQATMTMEPEQRRKYGISILTLMKKNKHYITNSAFLSESSSDVKQRLEVIMSAKRRTRWTGVFGMLLAGVMLFTTAAMAAAVHDQNPIKSAYAFNFKKDTGLVLYSADVPAEQWGTDDGTGRGRGSRDIVLINTPVYKNFYVNISVERYTLENGSKKSENMRQEWVDGKLFTYEEQVRDTEKKVVSQQIEVKMNQLLRVLNDGNDWVGLFTVKMNGKTVIDNKQGTIQNIPSNKKNGLTEFSISDEDKKQSFHMQSINFNFSDEELVMLNLEKHKQQDAFTNDANTKTLVVEKLIESTFPDYLVKKKSEQTTSPRTVFYNQELGKLDLKLYNWGTPYSVSADLDHNYDISEDEIKGVFFIRSGNEKIDEFQGTISGLFGKAGNTAVLRSDDGVYKFTVMIGEPKVQEKPKEDPAPDPSDEDYPHYQLQHSPKETKQTAVGDFPFSVTLNPEKDKVTVTYQSKKQYEAWAASMATYNASNEPNIWEEKNSKEGENTFTFSVLNDGSRHYINFTGYNAEPFVAFDRWELIFFISDGKLLFQQCMVTTTTNQNYTGDAARAFLRKTISDLNEVIDNNE